MGWGVQDVVLEEQFRELVLGLLGWINRLVSLMEQFWALGAGDVLGHGEQPVR